MNAAIAISSKAKRITNGVDPVDSYVGSRLRLRRNLVGMSQDQLGKASGLTFQQIQKYERGTNRISASRLFHLARLLNIQVSWFFEGFALGTQAPHAQHGFSDNEQTPLDDMPQKGDQLLYQRETLELIRGYYRIADPKQRRKVFELIKSMADSAE